MNKIYDIIIVGGGPAGLTASIYAQRAGLTTLLIEKGFAGGQVLNTYEVDNYPALPGIGGMELAMKMQEHAFNLGIQSLTEEVTELDLEGDIKKVKTVSEEYKSKSIMISTGAVWKQLGVKGEEAYRGKGVSYCATCDGAFFRDKVVAVIGGGDTAVEDAIYLAKFCKKVYLVHRRDELRAVKVLQNSLFKEPKIEMVWNSQLQEIIGEDTVTGMKVINNINEEIKTIELDGVFIAVGMDPNIELVKGKLELDNHNYIVANEKCETSIKGVYAIGDVRQKTLRQIITAAADGAVAVYTAQSYLMTLGISE